MKSCIFIHLKHLSCRRVLTTHVSKAHQVGGTCNSVVEPLPGTGEAPGSISSAAESKMMAAENGEVNLAADSKRSQFSGLLLTHF